MVRPDELAAQRDGEGPEEGAAGVTAPAQLDRPVTEDEHVPDRPWVTIVWNDPVNLMSYVTHVLMELFGYSRRRPTS
jgi:ATP-dependent Clp protease adaptor protein ClpS